MKEKMRSDWIVVKYDVTPNLFLCERCGQSYPLHTPAPIDIVIASGNAFAKIHRKCKPKIEVS